MAAIHEMVLQGLKQLKVEAPNPRRGICDNIYTVMDHLFGQGKSYVMENPDGFEIDLYIWIQHTATRWPKWSGDHTYPVPSPDSEEPAEYAYCRISNVWQGQYGQLRMELLDFLIQELENGTAATPA